MPDIDAHDEAAVRSYVDSLPPLQRGTAGGNTTCLEVRSGSDLIILDGGSGLRELGLELMKGPAGRGQATIHLVFTHCHWDHIQGFPFFQPAYIPGNRIVIYGVHDVFKALRKQQAPVNFPVPLSKYKAQREFLPIVPGKPFNIGRFTLNTIENIHPGKSYSFRIEDRHSSFVFATDAEYQDLDEAHLQPYIEFYQDADLLVFDSQYTLRDVWQKVDWGHSSALIGIDLARAARVKKLVLFHHDPSYSDKELQDILSSTQTYQSHDTTKPSCEVIMGYEGLTIDLTPKGTTDLQMVSDKSVAILTPFDGIEGISQAIRQLILLGDEYKTELTSSVLDLSNVETLTISSLKELVSLRQPGKGTPMILVAPSSRVQQVIELAGYRDYFVIYLSLETALAALQARKALNLPGAVIQGRYQIREKVDSDAWVPVLKATDLHSGELVAIKLISPSFAPSTLEKLTHQIERLMGVHEPHLVDVLGWGKEGEYIFIIEEYIQVPTLQEVLNEGSLPASIEEVSRIARDLVEGLEFLHRKGLVHGGFSPGNIFLTQQEAKLGGFGLGRLAEGHNLLETPPLILPVPYLSPEQILGQSLDARTDLFNLGVVLYQIFTGSLPYTITEQEVSLAHFNEHPVPPREYNPSISLSLEHMLLRLLSKNPNDRYASANQVSRIWESLSTGEGHPQAHHGSFHGREKELATLAQLWEVARAGRGQMALISGARGIGKSSLARQAAMLSKAAVVLTGSCREGDTQAYRLFAEVLRTYLGTVPPELDDPTTRRLLQNFTRIVPEIQQMMPDYMPEPLLAPEHEQLRLMSNLVQFVRQASRERPWVMILEDLQWIDSSSLQLFSYLGRHLTSMSLLMIGIYSEEEIEQGHPLGEILHELSRHSNYVHIPLPPLNQDEVEQLLIELWEQEVPPDLAGKIYQHTAGNPFYVEEIAKALVDDGLVVWEEGVRQFPALEQIRLPFTSQEAIRRRIARLSPDTLNLLQHAAVLGKTFQFEVLQEMMGLPKWQVLEYLDMALERQLIHEAPGNNLLSFQQTEIQQMLYEDISSLRRKLLHRQAGEVLEKRAMPLPEQIATELAQHFEQAGDFQNALTYYLEAAHQAKVAFANETAVRWYNRVLEIIANSDPTQEGDQQSSLVSTHKNIGEVLALLGRYDEALSHYNVVLAITDTIPQSIERNRLVADICRLIASVYENKSEYENALSWLDRGLSQLDKNEPTPELVYIYDLIGWVQVRQGQYRNARVPLQHALELAVAIQIPQVEINCLRNLGTVHWFLGENEKAREYWERSLSICRETGDRHNEGKVLNNLGLLSRDQGEYVQAKEYYEQFLLIAQETGNRLSESIALNNHGYTLRCLGDFSQAKTSLERALVICDEIGAKQSASMVLANLGLLAHAMGDQGSAISYGEMAVKLSQELGLRREVADALLCLGHAEAALGNLEKSISAYRQLLDLRKDVGEINLIPDALGGLASVLMEQGNLSEALIYVDEILQTRKAESWMTCDDPLRVNWVIYQVLSSAGDSRAREVLEKSYQLLDQKASQIKDSVLRRMYLENNPAHQAIWAELKRVEFGLSPATS